MQKIENTLMTSTATTTSIAVAEAGPFAAGSGASPGRATRWMNWLFADKARMFWVLQIAGWLGFFLLHVLSVSTFVAGRSSSALIYSVSSSFIGFLTTTILARPIYRLARKQGPILLLTLTILATLLMAVAMSAMKLQAFGWMFGNEWISLRASRLTNQLFLIVPDIPVNLFLLGSWAGFYFGINNYLNLRDETQRAVLAAHLADQAQLKMLRYQLNPHFLFNTLNAISTLVMVQDGKQANTMISQLSAFLRYSLDSDPLQKTTLAEEVRALKLYLEIEETRFADRLRVHIDIDDDVRDALVPSLILQPAIENAIKYAIAKMESGGELSISAKRKGTKLELLVVDNGPDAPIDPNELIKDATTGVGLVNMRDRLNYLYQEAGVFALSRVKPQGLRVSLEIPFEERT